MCFLLIIFSCLQSTLTIQVRCEFSTDVKQYVSLGKKLYCEIFNPDEFDATKSGTSSATPRTTPRVRTASQSKRNYSKQNQKNSGKNTSKYFKRKRACISNEAL